MPIDYTWSALVDSVRRRAMLGGSSDSDWTDAKILAVLNEEMQDYMVPLISTIGEEFFVAIEDFTTTASVAEYDIPSDSIASRVRDVQGLVSGNQYVPMQRIEPERAVVYAQNAQTAQPFAYYVQANQIVLNPTPDTTYSVRLKYYKRPRQIAVGGLVQSVSGGGGTLTVSMTASASSLGLTSGTYDLYSSSYPYTLLASDMPGTGTTSLTLTTTAAQETIISDNINVSYLSNSGDAPTAQIPAETIPVLCQRVAAVLLQAMRDPGAQQALDECEKALARARHMLTPRTDGLTRKVVNPYGVGWNGPWVNGRRGFS